MRLDWTANGFIFHYFNTATWPISWHENRRYRFAIHIHLPWAYSLLIPKFPGASGVLGSAVYTAFCNSNVDVIGLANSRSGGNLVKLDLTNREEVDRFFTEHKPDCNGYHILNKTVLFNLILPIHGQGWFIALQREGPTSQNAWVNTARSTAQLMLTLSQDPDAAQKVSTTLRVTALWRYLMT